MITKKKNIKFTVHEHLEHWVKKTSYAQRWQWLKESNEFLAYLKKKKNYPNLPKIS